MELCVIQSLSGWDICLLGVCRLSSIIGFVRGFTREISSVGGWLGAAVGTTYLFPLIRWHIRALVPNPLIADMLAGGGLF